MIKTRVDFLCILHNFDVEISPFVNFAQIFHFCPFFGKKGFTKRPSGDIMLKNHRIRNGMKKEAVIRRFKRIPDINTERLLLRRMRPEDCADMYEYSKCDDVTEYLLWSPHPNRIHTKKYLEYIKTRYDDGEFYDWAIELKSEGKMIGTCGFSSFDFVNNSAEVGYVINPAYQRHGYAPEALLEVMMFGFMELTLHRIEAKYMDGNDASRKVMDKLGMKYEGCARSSMFVKGKYRSIHTCAILSDEFIKRYLKSE